MIRWLAAGLAAVVAVLLWLVLPSALEGLGAGGGDEMDFALPGAAASARDVTASGLDDYDRFAEAARARNLGAVTALASDADAGYVEFLALRWMAGAPEVPIDRRLEAAAAALQLAVDAGLPEAEAVGLERASLLNEVGDAAGSAALLRTLLPAPAAQNALRSLVGESEQLAAWFLEAGLPQQALELVSGRRVPEIDAPALAALGATDPSLEAYLAWLSQSPTDPTASLGLASVLASQGRLEEAAAVLAPAPDPRSLSLRARIAIRLGEPERAIRDAIAAGGPGDLWRAARLLEEEGRLREAVLTYLVLAELPSAIRDDAAHRAARLAEARGEAALVEVAEDRVPSRSYLAVRSGWIPDLALDSVQQPGGSTSAVALARALAARGELQAATGELLVALHRAANAHEAAELATALVSLHEGNLALPLAEAALEDHGWQPRLARVAFPLAFADEVSEASRAAGVDPDLVWAVMREESRFQPFALSPAGAMGLMQIMPATWGDLAVELAELDADPFVPADNIRFGAHYLGRLIGEFAGDLELALAAYNAGPAYVRTELAAMPNDPLDGEFLHRLPDEPREYVERVLWSHAIYRTLSP